MRAKQLLGMSLAAGYLALSAVPRAEATEYTFSTYGLGSAAFGAGVTPPPGTYGDVEVLTGQRPERATQRNPTWHVEVSTGWAWRAAGR
jgi:hypothetical protein